MKQPRKVVMPPTEKASLFYKSGINNGLFVGQDYSEGTNQHLYLISDDEIKEGDWFVVSSLGKLLQCIGLSPLHYGMVHSKEGNYGKDLCKKVIASTDSELLTCNGVKREGESCTKNNNCKYPTCKLPQIPKSFIKAYVEANGEIDEVMVEYLTSVSTYFHDMTRGGSIRRGNDVKIIPRLKLTDNNEVIIHYPIYDESNRVYATLGEKMYSRDEVVALIKKHTDHIDESIDYDGIMGAETAIPFPEWDDEKWIEENL